MAKCVQPCALLELSQEPMKGETHPWACRKGFDAAESKFRPKEIFLKTNGEVYWEEMETDE